MVILKGKRVSSRKLWHFGGECGFLFTFSFLFKAFKSNISIEEDLKKE